MPTISPVPVLPHKKDAWWLALTFLILCTMVPFPHTDDTAHWHSMAYDLLHYGRWPYIGTWDQSFPGALLPHLLAQLVFGPSDLGFRIFDLLVQVCCCWMLYRLWRIWFDERSAIIIILLWAFTYARCAPFIGGMRDMYAAMLIVAASFPFLAASAEEISWTHVTNSGLLIGIAVTMRPTNEAYAIVIALFSAVRSCRRKALALIAIGLVPLALTFAVYALYPYALQEYWRATILFNADVYARLTRPFPDFFRRLISPKYLFICTALGLFVSVRNGLNIKQRHLQLYAAAIATSLLIVLVQRKYYSYHYSLFLLLLTPLAGIGIKKLLDYLPRAYQIPIFVSVFWIMSLPYESLIKHVCQSGISLTVIKQTYDDAVWPDPYERDGVKYVQDRTSASDRVEVCSFDPRMHLHMRRQSAGIYASLHPIGFEGPNGFMPYQNEWRRWYLDSLSTVRPKYIVLERGTGAEYLSDPYLSVLHNLPGFDSLLSTLYQLDTTIGQNEIFRLK